MRNNYEQSRKDIWMLLNHVKMDIDYGAQGSYGDGDKIDKKAINQTKRAINLLEDTYKLRQRKIRSDKGTKVGYTLEELTKRNETKC